MPDLHTPLVSPFAKLDIKDILKDSPSPPPRTTPAPAYSRSISVPSSYTQLAPLHSPSSSSSLSRYSTSTAPPNPPHRHQSHPAQQLTLQPAPPLSNTAQAVFQQNPNLNPAAASNKRSSPGGKHTSGPTTKGKGKWSPDEDAKIIVLRGRGMKWENISKEFPGRSAISCRLHYQNYLEKRADWDEEKRNKLARVYDRLKSDLWNPIATELGMPWRACEAMHWALGEAEMCRRANVLPFPVSAARADPHQPGAGRVAQRDRMRGNTRVFEGRDLSDIASSSFNSVDSKGHSTPQLAPPVPSSMAIPSISSGQGFPGYDGGEEDDDDEEEEKGPRARRRRIGGETRLPGLRELQLEEERPALQPEEAVEEAAER